MPSDVFLEVKTAHVDVVYYFSRAKIQKKWQKHKDKWKKMTTNYFEKSKMLRVVFQLVDSRHAPSQNDIEMYKDLVNLGFCPIIIATKVDKVKKSELKKNINTISSKLNTVEGTPVIRFSSSSGMGKEELWEYIEEYVAEFG